MNNEEKRQWIIKYAHKNKIDDILADKYKNEKDNLLKRCLKWLKKYCNEICSITTAFIVGFASISISIHSNELLEIQTQIMKTEQKPIIDIRNYAEDNNIDKLLVINKGTEAKNYDIKVFSFLNVFCNENGFGYVPIRVYLFDAVQHFERRNMNEIAEITLYNEAYPTISSLNDELRNIISKYTNLSWNFRFTHLIKITSIDIIGEENIDYFAFSVNGVERISNAIGDEIVAEYDCMIDNHDGTKTSKESFFNLEKSNADQIFKYMLSKIRNKNLYSIDFRTDEKILYGEYEP